MMSNLKPYFLVFVALCACLWGCEKNTPYPETPEIHFKKLVMKISGIDDLQQKLKASTLTFSFADGDGDLGATDSTSISKIHYSWLKKMPAGGYEPYIFASGATSETYLIPYDEVMNKEEAYNKLLKGTIDVNIPVPLNYLVVSMDTVHLEFFIVDRAAHSSNVEITPDFSLRADSVRIESDNAGKSH
jgi:hypothetical protein